MCRGLAEPEAPVEEEIVPVEEEVDNSATLRALYIVLPFVFFCDGGSCILYCLHKIYKQVFTVMTSQECV